MAKAKVSHYEVMFDEAACTNQFEHVLMKDPYESLFSCGGTEPKRGGFFHTWFELRLKPPALEGSLRPALSLPHFSGRFASLSPGGSGGSVGLCLQRGARVPGFMCIVC